MQKYKSVYICSQCGYQISKWLGKCPGCQEYNTFEETVEEKKTSASVSKISQEMRPTAITDIAGIPELRVPTNIGELDRVLSGGIVDGSITLLAGEPGIGKSTLLLQICKNLCASGKKVLYVSGEESAAQIKMRAERLGTVSSSLLVLPETEMTAIEACIRQLPGQSFVVIDSIQTTYKDEVSSTAGSVSQIRECAQTLMKIAKTMNISVFIVGHVTKEGTIAGPKILEHMVDTVLNFEGERHEMYRIIRSVKNRFGSTNEIGVFEMGEKGLIEISNPSEYLLSGRPLNVPGSAVTCSLEGTRPILTEVQSLANFTTFGNPRRSATGMDYNRVTMLIASLEKRTKLQLANYDIYVNIAGGMRIFEPSADAAVIAALASSLKNRPIDPHTLIFGEVGLTGELRAVTMSEKRVVEANKLGFQQCVVPLANKKNLKGLEGSIRIFGAANIVELLELCLS